MVAVDLAVEPVWNTHLVELRKDVVRSENVESIAALPSPRERVESFSNWLSVVYRPKYKAEGVFLRDHEMLHLRPRTPRIDTAQAHLHEVKVDPCLAE